AHPLAALVDDRAQRVQERGARLGVGEGAVTLPGLYEMRARPEPEGAHPARDLHARVVHPVRAREREYVVAPGQGEPAQQQGHLLAEAAARDEDKSLGALRERRVEL